MEEDDEETLSINVNLCKNQTILQKRVRRNLFMKASRYLTDLWGHLEHLRKGINWVRMEFSRVHSRKDPGISRLWLTTYWSALNTAGILSQKHDRVEHFISCWGRKCNRYEKHYPSMKGELLDLVKSMETWKHILKYQPPFLVYTVASSLKYIVSMKSDESIVQHWFAKLAQFWGHCDTQERDWEREGRFIVKII